MVAVAEGINIDNRQSRREISLLNPNSQVLKPSPSLRQINARHASCKETSRRRGQSKSGRLDAGEVESGYRDCAASGRSDDGVGGVESTAEVEVVRVERSDALTWVCGDGAHGLEGDVTDLNEVVLDTCSGNVFTTLWSDGGEVDVAEEA